MQAPPHILHVKKFTKGLLVLTIACLLISSGLVLGLANDAWRGEREVVFAFGFVWYCIIGGVYGLIVCLLGLLILLVSLRKNKLPLWQGIKTELLLFLAAVGAMVVLHLCCLTL